METVTQGTRNWLQRAVELDSTDSFAAAVRAEFEIPPGVAYLDGNSLGLCCRSARSAVLSALAEWGRFGVDGWLSAATPWFDLAESVAEQVAPWVGAYPDEVAVGASTTVQLHQLLATLIPARPERSVVVLDDLSFPSDSYAVAAQLSMRGFDPKRCIRRVPARDSGLVEEADLIAALDDTVLAVLVPGVVYTTGQRMDLARIAAAAHGVGALMGADCSHSVGVLPHRLHDWGVDFAVWCHYKYLNGGPGAPGGLFLHRRHHGLRPGLAGWWGSDKSRQFDMAPEMTPAAGAGALQIGTPSILSLAAVAGALELLNSVGVDRIRARSLCLTRFMSEHAREALAGLNFTQVTPEQDERRGGHLAFSHPGAARVCRVLKREGVVPDFRPPNLIRLAPAPLYTSYEECARAIELLADIVRSGRHLAEPGERERVA